MKRIFLTGASSGIGLAAAKLLVTQGDEVWGTSRNLERIRKMPRSHVVRFDLVDQLSIEETFNTAVVLRQTSGDELDRDNPDQNRQDPPHRRAYGPLNHAACTTLAMISRCGLE